MTETEDNLHAVIMGLKDELAEATERNGNLCVLSLELAAMRKARNAADDEATRLVIELAEVKRERDSLKAEVKGIHSEYLRAVSSHADFMTNLAYEAIGHRVAMTYEQTLSSIRERQESFKHLQSDGDVLRREVEALVGLIVRHVECVNCPRCEDECGNSCGKSIRDWAKQQAAQAGKDGEG